jgi:Peptidase family M28
LTSKKTQGILLFLFIVVLSIISLKTSKAPAVILASETDSFSAVRALKHLQIVSNAPHMAGTPEHEKVREYIVEFCKSRGLEVEIQSGMEFKTSASRVDAAYVQNIIATRKGTNPDAKAILVMSHYDSQMNTAAAADDGAGVAASLEVIDMLKDDAPFENDIIFLITDLEEFGLWGASHFVNNYERINDIGLLLNFEARGNSGASYSFETTTDNGWMIREFKKAVKKPITNALAYEIYKLMPNGTDFTEFKGLGITGINSAFIDGWAYYHSPADTPENIDLKSLQHQGDHILGMLRHFGNMDLENTKKEDAIFFNPIGGALVIYNKSLDIPLILLTVVLWLVCLFYGKKRNRVEVKELLKGTGLMLLALVIAMGLLYGYQQLYYFISSPESVVYANNKYFMGNTLWAILGIALITFALVFKRSVKGSFESTFLGGMLFLIILIVPTKMFLDTGGYVLYVPILIALVIFILNLIFEIDQEKHGERYLISQMLTLFIPIGIWIPMLYMVYIVFGIDLPFGAMLFMVFFFPFLVPTYKMLIAVHPKLVIYVGLILLVFGQVLQFTAKGYTETTPKFTYLNYFIDADKGEAYWLNYRELDDWTGNYFTDNEKKATDALTLNANRKRDYWMQRTAVADTNYLSYKIISHDTIGGIRNIKLWIDPTEETNSMIAVFPVKTIIENVFGATVNDVKTRDSKAVFKFLSVPKNGFELELSFPIESEPVFRLQEVRVGIPESLLNLKMPGNYVHDRYSSNEYFINQTFRFD